MGIYKIRYIRLFGVVAAKLNIRKTWTIRNLENKHATLIYSSLGRIFFSYP